MQAVPVLLDTDPGNDIDDALAIAYLLSQPKCQLVGITTVSGDVNQRAAIAEVLCQEAGRTDVPIVCGTSLSVRGKPSQPGCKHYPTIAHLQHRLDRKEDEAISFILDAVNRRPGEIVLLTIGPLSNIALCLDQDPGLPEKVKGIYSMAGAFWCSNNKEWNCRCDAEACRRVCRARRPSHTWFGLDVTTKCRMGREAFLANLDAPLLGLVKTMSEAWFQENDHVTFHDPLAAACVFQPSLCSYSEGRVTVASDGTTSFKEGEEGDRVAVEVKPDLFFEHFFQTVRGAGIEIPKGQ